MIQNENRYPAWMFLCGVLQRKHGIPFTEATLDEIRAQFGFMEQHYGEERRGYHNMDHIASCLKELSHFARLGQATHTPEDSTILAVEFALWKHDVIYDPTKNDNEARSADIAYTDALNLGFGAKFAKRVQRLVMATVHKPGLTEFDEQLIADVDISGMGYSWNSFKENGIGIRREYAHVPDKDFNEGRARILELFAEREHIYYLPYFRDRYQARARANLLQAVEEYRSVA